VIPVLGVPTLCRTDLLKKMLGSVDTEVGETLIIDNGGRVTDDIPGTVIRLPHNIGVGASWNLIFKLTPRAPWWCIVNDDVTFNPGALDSLATLMANEDAKIGILDGFSAFGVNQKALSRVGFFDENFHPAYCEDNDMNWRARLAGVPLVDLQGHTHHEGSATIRGNRWYHMQNSETFSENLDYYSRKWGGKPGQEVFTTPFNEGGDTANIRLEMRRLNHSAWARPAPGTS